MVRKVGDNDADGFMPDKRDVVVAGKRIGNKQANINNGANMNWCKSIIRFLHTTFTKVIYNKGCRLHPMHPTSLLHLLGLTLRLRLSLMHTGSPTDCMANFRATF